MREVEGRERREELMEGEGSGRKEEERRRDEMR